MENSLSLKEAQKVILLSQGINTTNKIESGKKATSKVIEELNYVQIDSISVVERAHHMESNRKLRPYSSWAVISR